MKTACYNILIKEMEVMSMKNKKMKSGGLLTLAFLMAAGNVMPALAGSWQQDGVGKTMTDPIMQAVGSGWTETGMVYRNVTISHRMATCLPIP